MRAVWYAVVDRAGRFLGAGASQLSARAAAVPALVASGMQQDVAEVEVSELPIGRLVLDAPDFGSLRAIVTSCCTEDVEVAADLLREIGRADLDSAVVPPPPTVVDGHGSSA